MPQVWGSLLGGVSFLIHGRRGMLPELASSRLCLAHLSDSLPHRSRSLRVLHQPSPELPALICTRYLEHLPHSHGCSPCQPVPPTKAEDLGVLSLQEALPPLHPALLQSP